MKLFKFLFSPFMKIKKMVNNILTRCYHVKIDETKILERVADLQIRLVRPEDARNNLAAWRIEASLQYHNSQDNKNKFEQLRTSLIK